MPYLLLKAYVSDEWYDLTPIAIVNLDNLELLKACRDKGMQVLELGEPTPNYIKYFNHMAVFYDVDVFEHDFGDYLDNGSPILLDDLPEGLRSLAPDSNRYIPVNALMIEICMSNPNEMFWTGYLKDSRIEISVEPFSLLRLDEYRFQETTMEARNEDESIQEGTKGGDQAM